MPKHSALPWLVPALAVVLAAVVVLAAGMGYLRVSPREILAILRAAVTGTPSSAIDPVTKMVVLDVRLPRILTAAAVGGGLAVAGVIFQAILLNPLADPYTLGVSSGAAFGASLAIVANITAFHHFSVPLFAFAGAVAAMAAVLALAGSGGRYTSTSLILSGVIIAAILSAGIGFLKYIADEQVSVIIFWLMGSFASRTWQDALLAGGATAAGLAVALVLSRDLNIMCLGGRAAESLGVNTARTRKILICAATLITAACVSVSGIIGFVGLIVPHLLRFLAGPDNRLLLPASLLAGAILLLAADTITRAVLPAEVPIGILTSLIGGPFFCYIFRRRQLGRVR